MLEKFAVCDVGTGKVKVEEIEVEEITENPIFQPPTLDERVEYLENTLNQIIVAVLNDDTELLKRMRLNK